MRFRPSARLIRLLHPAPLLLVLMQGIGASLAAEPALDREARCLALIAFAEASSEGEAGMAAVIRVVRNRARHAAFPRDACAVVAQAGQFQPIEESPSLRKAVGDPESRDLADVLGATSSHGRAVLARAQRLALAGGAADSTGGALYFVNPLYMDKGKCPWFAGLKRTTAIGGHVFMTHYAAGEARGEPALDCRLAGSGLVAGKDGKMARPYQVGLFHPDGPRVTSRTPTRNMLRAWKKSGQLAKRQAALKKLFKPGWYLPE